MKLRLLLVLFCASFCPRLQAQPTKIFHETISSGAVLYATNSALYPVSIALNLELSNMYFSGGGKRIFVIPPSNVKFKIGELVIADAFSRYSFNYKFVSTMGDVTITNYDKLFEYDLPFRKYERFMLRQGYNGPATHQNENALDFSMPEGTEILAARDGTVVQVEKSNTEACPREECSKFNNYVVVMHADGTFASYVHIRYNGTSLTPGSAVKKGDVIAYSGNVGWSSGPHLHFACFLGQFGKVNTLETKFKIEDGSTSGLLQPGNFYLRGY